MRSLKKRHASYNFYIRPAIWDKHLLPISRRSQWRYAASRCKISESQNINRQNEALKGRQTRFLTEQHAHKVFTRISLCTINSECAQCEPQGLSIVASTYLCSENYCGSKLSANTICPRPLLKQNGKYRHLTFSNTVACTEPHQCLTLSS